MIHLRKYKESRIYAKKSYEFPFSLITACIFQDSVLINKKVGRTTVRWRVSLFSWMCIWIHCEPVNIFTKSVMAENINENKKLY